MMRAVQRAPRTIPEAGKALNLIAAIPLVMEVPADAVVAAGLGNISRHLLGMADYRQPPPSAPLELLLCHLISCPLSETSGVIRLCQF